MGLRARGAAAVAVALVGVGGCTSTVAGHGQLAASQAPAGTAPAGSTAPPPGSGLPSLPLPPGGGVNPNPEIPDSPCDVLDRTELKQQFGQDADIQTDLDSCKITSSDGSFLSFNTYAALTLNYEKNSETGRAATIAGQPAYIAQNDHYIVVGRSKNPDNRGIVTCYVGFSGSSQLNGIQLATRLLEELMPHYVY